jgi:thymidine phosphorylase
VGDEIGLALDVVITEANQPIGRGIGPVLEARDVMAVLGNDPMAPADLKEKSLRLAGRLLEFDPRLRGGSGYERARILLESGKALEAMERIIAAQGPTRSAASLGTLTLDVPAPRDGMVTSIDCFRLARIARMAGAPMDKGAGIEVMARIGDRVEKRQPLYRIFACFEADFGFATEMAGEGDGYGFADSRP